MSADAKVPTAADRIAAALAKREALKAAEAAAFAEQQAIDLEALIDIEAEHGFERVVRIDIGGWKPGAGAATMVVARVPTKAEKAVRRYEETVSKAKAGSTTQHDAAVTLAGFCIVYPDKDSAKDLYDATLELAAGVMAHVGVQVMRVVQGNAEEEKKG